jgi:hypothetical protein
MDLIVQKMAAPFFEQSNLLFISAAAPVGQQTGRTF